MHGIERVLMLSKSQNARQTVERLKPEKVYRKFRKYYENVVLKLESIL